MGVFSLDKKTSPNPDQAVHPPPYNNSEQSPLIVTETTTTRTEIVTTTTETTTHFLSFPAWRKRSNIHNSSSQCPRTAGSIDRNASRTPLMQRDKALPPTPSDSPAHSPLPSNTSEPSSQIVTLDKHGGNLQLTSLLSQTSLGLGLSQHVLPRTTSGPGDEVNTVAFISTPPSQPVAEPSSTVRRSKSSQRLSTSSNLTSPTKELGPRTRGVSLLGFTASGARGDAKEKEKDKVSQPPKPLSRKSSFWSRRKDPSQSRPVTAHGDISQQHRSLEVNLSDLSPPPPRRQKLQARDPLSRSSLERPQSHCPTLGPDFSISPVPGPPPPQARRPSTAGSPIHAAEHNPATGHLALAPTRTTTVSFSGSPAGEKVPVPRVRSQTNPPLLHRLSLNVFSSPSFLTTSPASSPISPLLSTASDPLRKPVIIPRPLENEESPDIYVNRLMDAISKVEVTNILASSAEPFYVAALKAFIGRFNFVADPLDIALRKLLLEIGLPKETQQIDRVLEAFAKRYIQCNPNLYVSEDHPYILAFSLIMLHTDAFNKSNRHKMTKPDYIKNTSLPGVTSEILEYFYDNIIFAPFIFIEDPLDLNGQRGLALEPNRRSTIFRDVPSMTSGITSPGSTLGIKTNKIDPYYMISNDLLSPLQIDVETYIPSSDPFTYKGTAENWDEEDLLRAFTNAHVVEVGVDATRSSPFFGIAAGGPSSPLITASAATTNANQGEPLTLRVTKFGLMNRKDELCEGGKKPLSRKWKPWGVLLTGSQLLFSRDPIWMHALVPQTEGGGETQDLVPPSAILKVDELVSLKNALAVYDKSYTKHRFTFRLVLSDGRHLLLKASSEDDMNQWISRINYASTFKTAGVRMRPLGMSGRSMELTGVAAATSHLHDLQNRIHSPSGDSAKWDENAPRELFEMLSGDGPVTKRPQFQRRVTLKTNREEVELEAPMPLEVEKTTEFKDAFDQVKADLAAESWTSTGKDSVLTLSPTVPLPLTPKGDLSPRAGSSFEVHSQEPSSNGHPLLPSRSQIIDVKIAELDNQLITMENHLEKHMLFVRNVATLAPFQKATRARLVTAIQTRARSVMQLRLDVARMRCHRNVLRDDMLAENRVWKEVKDTALKAAKETLQARQSLDIPQVTLPMREPCNDSLARSSLLQKRQKSVSSICESFHTAIDFGPDWPSSDDLGSSFLAASRVFDSPRPSTSGSLSSYPYDGSSSRIWKSEPASAAGSQADHDTTPKGEEVDMQHGKFYTAQEGPEEAEEWDKTRCAKRVSLVRVPSTLDLLPVSKRLTLTLSTTTEPNL